MARPAGWATKAGWPARTAAAGFPRPGGDLHAAAAPVGATIVSGGSDGDRRGRSCTLLTLIVLMVYFTGRRAGSTFTLTDDYIAEEHHAVARDGGR